MLFLVTMCSYAIKREFIRYFQKQPTEVFCKKDTLRDFAEITEKHLRWSLFLIKALKETPAQIFTVSIAKFLSAPVPKNICERLLMYI